MLHILISVLGFMTALALLAVAVRALFAVKHYSHGGPLSVHPVQHTLEQYFDAKRYTSDLMSGTKTSAPAAQGGWSIIDRNLRAKRAIRLAVQ